MIWLFLVFFDLPCVLRSNLSIISFAVSTFSPLRIRSTDLAPTVPFLGIHHDGLPWLKIFNATSHGSICFSRGKTIMNSEVGEVSWNENLERYFAEQGEQAHGLSMLHKHAESLYSYRRTWIEMPVITISSITGFLSVGSTSMFEGQQMASSVVLGVCSLLVSVLQTVGTYFGWAKRAEGHRISSIQYSRLHRHLKIEMGLPREQRQAPGDLLKFVKDTIDRLQETSPLVPREVIVEYQRKYEKVKDISHPAETNGLEKVLVYQENPLRLTRQETVGIPETPLPPNVISPTPS